MTEALFMDLEITLQYVDGNGQAHEERLIVIERKDIVNRTVCELKRTLLSMNNLDFIPEQPEQLDLFLIADDGYDTPTEVSDEEQVMTYFKELGCAKMLRLRVRV